MGMVSNACAMRVLLGFWWIFAENGKKMPWGGRQGRSGKEENDNPKDMNQFYGLQNFS